MLIFTWIQFAVCIALIGWGGFKLSSYGDVIAEKTGMGGTWIGLILIASVTSLQELAVSHDNDRRGHHRLAVPP